MPERRIGERLRASLRALADGLGAVERSRREYLDAFDMEAWLRRAGISRDLAEELSGAARAEGELDVATSVRQRLGGIGERFFGGLAEPPGLVIVSGRGKTGEGSSPDAAEHGPPEVA